MTETAAHDLITNAAARDITALDGAGPEDLVESVSFRLRKDLPGGITVTDLVQVLTTSDVNNLAKTRFRIQLGRWDSTSGAGWLNGEKPNTEERRQLIYGLLGFSADHWAALDAEYPRDMVGATVISAEQPWEPWYTPERASARDFYRSAYRGVLERKGWSGEALAALDGATDEVVKRLADPERLESYQSKGLVVGYVQSGKTANFTGVIAKAMDAGYRLVIVLTGTVEILRSQTQRRLDMELVGKQNILGGIEETDLEAMASVDYYKDGDQDWLTGMFLEHTVDPVTQDAIPGITRLTSPNWDYKKLLAGLSALDFRDGTGLIERSKPLYDPKNLYRTNVRLAVVKKNKATLDKLVSDLKKLRTNLGEIPALIIDDEADQASINTINPRKNGIVKDDPDRTAINKKIVELLTLMPRCQYIGYTATPFANVFVDPDNSEDLFPRDFILSLDRPIGYMGGADFHDFGLDALESKNVANSNEKAYVRGLVAVTSAEREAEIQQALDAFVLSGAIKLFRESRGAAKFGHHTMLVHESVKQDEHRILANEILQIWSRSGYSSPDGLVRLRALWENDFKKVSEARAGADDEVPDAFDVLVPHIGRTVDKVSGNSAAVIIVNGASERDYAQAELNFQEHEVWKILVGGAKLSRGFTVEGLTVTYYTRRALQADTLMQMGRWFGFRPGYRDLVRLYIGRKVPGPAGKVFDLYEAFGAIVRDEEEFRSELKRFSHIDEEGHPTVRPINVPPLVYQQLPWLKPTGATKMYNAELTTKGAGGELVDFPMQADRGDGTFNAAHFDAVYPFLSVLSERGTFEYVESVSGRAVARQFEARYGLVSADVVLETLEKFHWTANWKFAPHADFIRRAIEEQTLTDFAVLMPELAKPVRRMRVGSWAEPIPVGKRTRRNAAENGSSRPGFSGSSFRQRDAIEHIAGSKDKRGGALAEELHTDTRGALLLTFAADPKSGVSDPLSLKDPANPCDVATLFSYALPRLSAPNGRIAFRARKKGSGLTVPNVP